MPCPASDPGHVHVPTIWSVARPKSRLFVSSRDQNNSPKAACGPAVQKTDQHTVAEAALELDIHATAAVAWPDELSHYSCAAREITSRSFLRVSFCDAT